MVILVNLSLPLPTLFPVCTGSRAPKDLGQLVAREIESRRRRQEFNTIAVDDGIAMGIAACCTHCQVVTSLLTLSRYGSRPLRGRDGVYPNCDKIAPVCWWPPCALIFLWCLSAPMKRAKVIASTVGQSHNNDGGSGVHTTDSKGTPFVNLTSSMLWWMPLMISISDEDVRREAQPVQLAARALVCLRPILWTALTEALGLSRQVTARYCNHAMRRELFWSWTYHCLACQTSLWARWRLGVAASIATKAAFENAMSLDIAMGGSTNDIASTGCGK